MCNFWTGYVSPALVGHLQTQSLRNRPGLGHGPAGQQLDIPAAKLQRRYVVHKVGEHIDQCVRQRNQCGRQVSLASMPFKPLPTDGVPGGDLIKLPPQVVVLDGFTVCSAPLVCLPARQPRSNALTQSFGIGEKRHLTGRFEVR